MLMFVIALGSQNSQIVSVNFLIVRQELTVASILSIGMLIGGVIMFALFSVWNVKMMLKVRHLQKKSKQSNLKENL